MSVGIQEIVARYFYFCLDTALVNAYILFKDHCLKLDKTPLKHLEVNHKIGLSLMSMGETVVTLHQGLCITVFIQSLGVCVRLAGSEPITAVLDVEAGPHVWGLVSWLFIPMYWTKVRRWEILITSVIVDYVRNS